MSGNHTNHRGRSRGRSGGRGRGRGNRGRGARRGRNNFGDDFRRYSHHSGPRENIPDRAQTHSASLEGSSNMKRRNFIPHTSKRPGEALRLEDLRALSQKESFQRSIQEQAVHHQQQTQDMGPSGEGTAGGVGGMQQMSHRAPSPGLGQQAMGVGPGTQPTTLTGAAMAPGAGGQQPQQHPAQQQTQQVVFAVPGGGGQQVMHVQQVPLQIPNYQMQIQYQITHICNVLNQSRMGIPVYPQLALSNPTYYEACTKLFQMHSAGVQDLNLMGACQQMISQINNAVIAQAQRGQAVFTGTTEPMEGMTATPAAPTTMGAPPEMNGGIPAAATANGTAPSGSSSPQNGSISATPMEETEVAQSPTNPTPTQQQPAPVQFGPNSTAAPTAAVAIQQPQQMTPQQMQALQQQQQQQQVAMAQGQFPPGAQPQQQYVLGQFVYPAQGAQATAAGVQQFQMVPTHIPQQAAPTQQQQQAALYQQQQNYQFAFAQQQQQQQLYNYQVALAQQQAAIAQAQAAQQTMAAQQPAAQPTTVSAFNPSTTGQPAQFGLAVTMPQQQPAGAPAMAQGQPVPGQLQVGAMAQPQTGQAAPPVQQGPTRFGQHLMHAHDGTTAPGQLQPGTAQTSILDLNSQPYTPSQPAAPEQQTAIQGQPQVTPGQQGQPTAQAQPFLPTGVDLMSGGGLSLNPNAQEFHFSPSDFGGGDEDDPLSPQSALNPTASVFQPTISTAPVRTQSITSLHSIQEAEDEQEQEPEYLGAAIPLNLEEEVVEAFETPMMTDNQDENGEESVEEDIEPVEAVDFGEDNVEDFDEEVEVPQSGPDRMKNFYDQIDEDENGEPYGTFSDDPDADFLADGAVEDPGEEEYDYENDRDETSGGFVDYVYPPYEIGELLGYRADERCQETLENFGMDETDRRTLNKLKCDRNIIVEALKAMDAELPQQQQHNRRDMHDRNRGGGQSWRQDRPRRGPRRQNSQNNRRRKARTFLPPTEGGYSIHAEVPQDELVQLKRKIRSLLNKITPERFERLATRMQETIDERVHLREHFEVVLESVIDVAIQQPVFAEQYAQLCCHLSAHLVPVIEAWPWVVETKQKPAKIVRWLVMKTCEARHQTYFQEAKRDESEVGEAARAATKRNLLGTMAVIGELYNKKLMSEKIIHMCIIQPTLRIKAPNSGPDGSTDGEVGAEGVTPIEMEAVCRLLTVCGGNLDSSKAEKWMTMYFKVLRNESRSMENRIKFMVMDISDLRSNRWRAKIKKDKPKKLGEVRKGESGSQDARHRGRGGSGAGFNDRRSGPRSNGNSSRQAKRYQIAGNNTKGGGKHAWEKKPKQKGQKKGKSNGGMSGNNRRKTTKKTSRDDVVEDAETPRRGALSRLSSASSDGSVFSASTGDRMGNGDVVDMKTTDDDDLATLKQQAHSRADEYFASHVSDDLVAFYTTRVSSQFKTAVVSAMLNRIFCNKKPEDFRRLPKLFKDLVSKDALSREQLASSLVMLTVSFDEDAVDAPRLPEIFASFVSDMADDDLIAMSAVVPTCRGNLNERNFCKFMMYLTDKLEALENTAALNDIQGLRIRFENTKMAQIVFMDHGSLLRKYFR